MSNMHNPEFEGRDIISPEDPGFNGSFVSLYEALVREWNKTLRKKRVGLNRGEKLVLPGHYALLVEDDDSSRRQLFTSLLLMLARSLRDQKRTHINTGDVSGIIENLSSIQPMDVSSPEFPLAVNHRVHVKVGLVKGGFVEALAATMRAQLERGEGLQAAKAIARPVQGTKGLVEMSSLQLPKWSAELGHRIITQDDKSAEPVIAAENQHLYRQLFVTFDDYQDEIQEVIVMFDMHAEKLTRTQAPRDPDYLCVQWRYALYRNLLRLDPDMDKLKQVLAAITMNLHSEGVKNNTKGFIQVIERLHQLA